MTRKNKDPFGAEGDFNQAEDISVDKIMDKVEEISVDVAESVMSMLERARKILDNYSKKHKCYEHERAARAVDGAMNFMKKAEKSVDDE